MWYKNAMTIQFIDVLDGNSVTAASIHQRRCHITVAQAQLWHQLCDTAPVVHVP
jgi:hypothetical protein